MLRAPMLALTAAMLAIFALPAAGGATGFSQLYQDYGSDGQIQACKYSAGDLRNAAGSVPPDVQAYDPGFGDALNGALGAPCGGGESAIIAAAPPPGSGSGPGSGPSSDPRVADRKLAKHVARDGSPRPIAPLTPSLPLSAPVLTANQDVPAALVALAATLILLIVTGGGLAVRRYFGWDLARASGPSGMSDRDLRGRLGGARAGLLNRVRR